MSSRDKGTDYENYSDISKGYDTRRQPIGVDVILGAITRVTGGKTTEATVVDIGCGTGNYALSLSPYVKEIIGIDINTKMIEEANKKNIKNLRIIQGDITKLDQLLPKECCDVAICTVVLHHLEDSVPPDYPGPSKVISDAYRIMKDRGAIIINTLDHHQMSDSIIFIKLAPKRVQDIFKPKFPPVSLLCNRLEEVGFTVQSVLPHCYKTESVVKTNLQSDIEGPLHKEWLNATSTWSLATDDEIQLMQENWREMIKDGRAQALFDEVEEMRRKQGESTTILAYKGINN